MKSLYDRYVIIYSQLMAISQQSGDKSKTLFQLILLFLNDVREQHISIAYFQILIKSVGETTQHKIIKFLHISTEVKENNWDVMISEIKKYKKDETKIITNQNAI